MMGPSERVGRTRSPISEVCPMCKLLGGQYSSVIAPNPSKTVPAIQPRVLLYLPSESLESEWLGGGCCILVFIVEVTPVGTAES